jgi:hypothetical protein
MGVQPPHPVPLRYTLLRPLLLHVLLQFSVQTDLSTSAGTVAAKEMGATVLAGEETSLLWVDQCRLRQSGAVEATAGPFAAAATARGPLVTVVASVVLSPKGEFVLSPARGASRGEGTTDPHCTTTTATRPPPPRTVLEFRMVVSSS